MKKETKIQPMDEKNLKLFSSVYLYRKEKEVKTQKIEKKILKKFDNSSNSSNKR